MKQEIFEDACKNRDLLLAKKLLQDPEVNPTNGGSYILRLVAHKGYCEIVKLLLEDGRADPYLYDSHALVLAADNEQTETVKLLLEDGRTNKYELKDTDYEYLLKEHV
jgi:ankyrin repeat protein